MQAHIIVDLGFGDSGKGLLTDFLCRHLHAGLVVRYNGGAQAGHNVITPDKKHHTFSQFGSGSFLPGVKTFLSKHVVIHPQALLVEGDILTAKGCLDIYSRLRISDQALVITPFHQAVNRIKEMIRGAQRHGSCGVGVGDAVEDALSNPEERISADDLSRPELLRQKLKLIRARKREQADTLCKGHALTPALIKESMIFVEDTVIDAWIASAARITQLNLITTDSTLARWLRENNEVVFEGAQGVLLDADHGFHPYTTWSRCTSANALELIQQMAPGSQWYQIGVLRSYMARHGPGPLPTETSLLTPLISEHNLLNDWQGNIRYGWFDFVLARYAIEVNGGIDYLAITHFDILSRMESWKYCSGYENFPAQHDLPVALKYVDDILKNFRLDESASLDEREVFAKALMSASPWIESCDSKEDIVLRKIGSTLGQPMGIISRGPTANDTQAIDVLP